MFFLVFCGKNADFFLNYTDFCVNLHNSCQGRAAVQGCYKVGYLLVVALGQDFYTIITCVADPACKMEAGGKVHSPRSKPHPLHFSMNQSMELLLGVCSYFLREVHARGNCSSRCLQL